MAVLLVFVFSIVRCAFFLSTSTSSITVQYNRSYVADCCTPKNNVFVGLLPSFHLSRCDVISTKLSFSRTYTNDNCLLVI